MPESKYRAEAIVEKERGKSKEELTDRDWGLVTHIQQGIEHKHPSLAEKGRDKAATLAANIKHRR